jgi:glycosyltransferase involved in cell wall biosynthesis
LDAIAKQTVQPFEVIVVDNNSSDDTVAVARKYPFVKVIRETRQGVVYARDRGFRAAKGEIIGRIDGDTRITPNWVETLTSIFSDENVDVVTGSVRYYDMTWAPVCNRIDLILRRHLARVLGREVAIQGANMGIRRSVWRAIESDLCRQGGMHEDFDVGIHANELGYNVKFDETLVISLGFRQAESCFEDFSEYLLLNPRTYALHGLKSHRHMYPVICIAMVFYLPIKIAHRGYDMQKKRFSFAKLMTATAEVRVNPGTYVD